MEGGFVKGKNFKETLDEELARNFIGGIGFCMKMLYDGTGPMTNPLGSENLLIFAVGPLNGTVWPSASICEVAAKSPATGLIGYANFGGYFGPEIKWAGYDSIVIQGKAKSPVYLWIDDNQVEIRNATNIWGKNTWETEDILRAELGDPKIRIACIGQAGRT